MPAMSANQMEKYCDKLTGVLQDPAACEKLITDAAKIVEGAANQKFDTDTIRTEPFTEKVINLARAASTA